MSPTLPCSNTNVCKTPNARASYQSVPTRQSLIVYISKHNLRTIKDTLHTNIKIVIISVASLYLVPELITSDTMCLYKLSDT